MKQETTALVARARGLLEGFEIHNRDDQIGLMAVLTVYQTYQNRYPASPSDEVTALLSIGDQLYRQYLAERMRHMGAKIDGESIYDQSILAGIAGRDAREADQLAHLMFSPLRVRSRSPVTVAR